jgi:parvulin-like peptidyl-prolyl isomerase
MMYLRLSVLAALITVAATCAGAKEASAPGSKSASTASAPLTVDGKPVTNEELSSFSLLLETTEGRPIEDRSALMDEYVLTQLHEDLMTTLPAEKSAKSPYIYPTMGQRQVLKAALQREVQKTVHVPREAMESWYKENVSKYVQPARVKAYHLFMETSNDQPSSAPEKVRERITAVKAEADKGTSFSQLAQKFSEASSGKTGGEIGYVTPGMPIGPQSKPMNIVLENALFALEPGHVSDVVQTSHGLHLLYISDKTTTSTPTLDEMMTSGILPGAVSNEYVTSGIRKLIAESISKHGGKIAETSGSQTELTTGTEAFTFDGRKYRISDMENLYGARFTRFYQRAQGNAKAMEDLLKQGLDDEAMVQAAVDKGLDKSAENRDQLALLGKRGAAVKHIQRIIAEAYPVSAEKAQALYDQQKDQLRQPEAEGFVLIAQSKDAASPAETGRNRDLAQRQAEAAREMLTGGTPFDQAAAKVATKEVETSAGQVERHVLGQTTSTLGRAFDQATAAIKEGEISPVVPFGNDYAIAKLTRRYPGEPVPFERLRGRLLNQAQMDNERNARKDLVQQLKAKGRVKYADDSSTSGSATSSNSNQ